MGLSVIGRRVTSISLRLNFAANSPIPTSPENLGPRKPDEPRGKRPFRQAIGNLMWLANMARLDIANGAGTWPVTLRDNHWESVLKILADVKETLGCGLTSQKRLGTGPTA